MGNELAKKYDMPKTHSASGGHECLWKIYQATAKATGEQVCGSLDDKSLVVHLDKQ